MELMNFTWPLSFGEQPLTKAPFSPKEEYSVLAEPFQTENAEGQMTALLY